MKSLNLVCLGCVMACSFAALHLQAQTSAAPNTASPLRGERMRGGGDALPKRARAFYQLYWGVDSFRAKAVESGELIRFSYRVLDADKAQQLNEKQNEPFMIAPRSLVRLVIPSLEKVGQLRQTSTPEPGKTYWMAFSNPGRLVRPGDRVDVVIGPFHINGLMVE